MQPSYYSEYARVQQTHWWYRGRTEILETVIGQHLSPTRNRLLLDIGCGPGGMRPMLSQFGKLVSTDLNPAGLQYCLGQKLDWLVAADNMHLPFRDGAFGAVCAFDVIEHIRDDHAALSELYRVTQPGGLLFITVPAFGFLWGRQDVVSQHYRRYSAQVFRERLMLSGYSLLRLSYFNTWLFPPIAAVRLLYRVLGVDRGKAPERVRSDFSIRVAPWLNHRLHQLFASEKFLLRNINLPFGVSLLGVAQKSS